MDDGELPPLQGLSRPAQQRAGPLQGRPPLPPRRPPRRRQEPRLPHDHEVLPRRRALRRRQGRHQGRPLQAHAKTEMERIVRRFTVAIAHNIGPDYDIPAPDVGSNAQHMAWIADTYTFLSEVGGHQPEAVITGKPVEFGGSVGREKATGQGVVDTLVEMLPEIGINPGHARSASSATATWAHGPPASSRPRAPRSSPSWTTPARSSQRQGPRRPRPRRPRRQDRRRGGLPRRAERIAADEFYKTKVDVMVPARLEQMIQEPEAKMVNCKVVAEGANAPTTPAGDRVFNERGIEVLPADPRQRRRRHRFVLRVGAEQDPPHPPPPPPPPPPPHPPPPPSSSPLLPPFAQIAQMPSAPPPPSPPPPPPHPGPMPSICPQVAGGADFRAIFEEPSSPV